MLRCGGGPRHDMSLAKFEYRKRKIEIQIRFGSAAGPPGEMECLRLCCGSDGEAAMDTRLSEAARE